MLIGRQSEIKQLQNAYVLPSGSSFIIYGRSGIGKTALAREFVKGKPKFYFLATDLSERELALSLAERCAVVPGKQEDTAYLIFRCFQSMAGSDKEKTVLVFDEFHHLFLAGESFKNAYIAACHDEKLKNSLFFIFLSSSVNRVENNLVEMMGVAARELKGIFKLKELTFSESVDFCKGASIENIVYMRAVLGGVPGLMRLWNHKIGPKENIINLFLTEDAPLKQEAERFLKAELRELGSYNTILKTIALGSGKLNEVYERTDYSRAKISVYLKNLIELDAVEKVFSVDAGKYESLKKGVYRIKDTVLRFYYRFVFPHLSDLEMGNMNTCLDEITGEIGENHMREAFAGVCQEYLSILASLDKLEFAYDTFGKWNGKEGIVDIVAIDEDDHMLVGFTSFKNEVMQLDTMAAYKELMNNAGVKYHEMYIFARAGFSADLKRKAAYDNVKLINLDEF